MNPAKIEIVVARYDEDVRWLRWLHLDRIDRVLVFNKGGEHVRTHHAFPMEKMMLVKAPNVGREGHTFYTYIAIMYERLPEHVIFLQGAPFDHTPHLVDFVERFLDTGDKPNFTNLSEETYRIDFFNYRHAGGSLPLQEMYRRVFGVADVPPALEWTFGAGAQMIVSREAILRRPKEFYQNIADILSTSVDPIEGYCMERLHPLVFM
jgi:hypothetical protein